MCTKRLNPSIEITLLLSNLKYIIVDYNFIEINGRKWKEEQHEISSFPEREREREKDIARIESNAMYFLMWPLIVTHSEQSICNENVSEHGHARPSYFHSCFHFCTPNSRGKHSIWLIYRRIGSTLPILRAVPKYLKIVRHIVNHARE